MTHKIVTKTKLFQETYQANRKAFELHISNAKNIKITKVEKGYLVSWSENSAGDDIK